MKKEVSVWNLVYVYMDYHKLGEEAGFKCPGHYASAQRNLMCSCVLNRFY